MAFESERRCRSLEARRTLASRRRFCSHCRWKVYRTQTYFTEESLLKCYCRSSDTVASTLISIFYHLADDPTQTTKLRAELDKIDNLQDFDQLKSMAHLNGVINEALRLHPALPSGGLRQTPPDGLMIAGRFIPGNVTIAAPRYSLGRRK